MEFRYEVKIPKQRVAILVGVKGEIKKNIQANLGIKLYIDSDNGDVELIGDDSLKLLIGQNIVKAIGRGFNPEIALNLLDDEYGFESLDITDFISDKKNDLIRAKSRVIGTEGKARLTIERLTDTKTVIYGKTISIIGYYQNIGLCRRAFEGLLNGQRHATIFSWLEKQKKKMRNEMY